MTRHIATYVDPITKEDLSAPEVWVIPPKGTPSRFRLAGLAKVIVRFPSLPKERLPELQMVAEQLPGEWWKGFWGGIQNILRKSRNEPRDNFEVEVEGQIWECDSQGIVRYIEELQDTIRKRNFHIEKLRGKKRIS